MRLTKLRLLGLVGGLVGLLTVLIVSIAAAPSASASSTRNFLVTLYGWPDNSPPGNAIAYGKGGGNPSIHSAAGGLGTYANPITFATDKSELPVGSVVYYPYLHRYFIMEDDCTECDEDWTGQGPDGGPHMNHIDLWIGGQNADSGDVVKCEDELTRGSEQVVIDPPGDEPVDTTPLFNSSGNKCYNPSSFKGGNPGGTTTPSPSAKPSARPTHPAPSPSAGHPTVTATPTPTVSATHPNGPGPITPPTPGTFSAIAGPGCGNSTPASFIGVGYSGGIGDDWNPMPGNDGTGSGCSNGFLAMPMTGDVRQDGQNRGLWVFYTGPVTSGTCTLKIYVPKPPTAADDFDVDGTSATYGVFDGTSTHNATQIGQFVINQTAHRGGYVLETGLKITQPLLVVRLYDRGIDYTTNPKAMYGVAAIRATCD